MIEKYYEGTPQIITLSTEIGKLLGFINSSHYKKPKTELRRKNRIKTIHSSLSIEGNTLSIDQVTDILDQKRVVGPRKDIREVVNAIEVYTHLNEFNPFEEASYLRAHKLLMAGLINDAGSYRNKGVGIFKGDQLAHMAPPAWNVSHLMQRLFKYLEQGTDTLLIKSCVFHYEMEFIHPFMDGNGRMGRLWQTVILMLENPVFEYLPVELEIKNSQDEYYRVLAQSDKEGISTIFVEYILAIIKRSLETLIDLQRQELNKLNRLSIFLERTEKSKFSRKDYLQFYKDISTATASRDLKNGVKDNLLDRKGDGRTTFYTITGK